MIALDADGTRARIDRLFAGDGHSAEALALCASLRATLDPADPADGERILRAAGAARGRAGSWETEVLRVAAEATDPALRRRAAVVAAQCADHRGDAAAAGARYRALLRDLRGTGAPEERAACVNLVRLFLLAGREYEALVLSRAAGRMLVAAGDDWGLANLLLHRGRVLLALEDLPRTAGALAEAAAALGRVPPTKVRLLRYSLEGLRARERLAAGDAAGCLAALDRADACAASASVPLDPRIPRLLRARALRAAGDGVGARVLLDRVLAAGPAGDATWFEARAEDAILAGETEAVARARARSVLDDLRAAAPGRTGAGWRLRFAADLARRFRDDLHAPEDARAAWDVAAAAVLDRMAELDAARRELPELDAVLPEDVAVLEEYRRRVEREQRALLDAVHAALVDAAARGGGLPAALLAADGDLHAVCAWCRRLRRPDGAWVPLGPYVPATVPVRVTHGICDVCRGVLAREAGEAAE